MFYFDLLINSLINISRFECEWQKSKNSMWIADIRPVKFMVGDKKKIMVFLAKTNVDKYIAFYFL